MYNSTFMGLNTSLRGLLAHQAAMDVTGHNISNINTEGYSRQRAELVATRPISTPAFNATQPGMIGTGVEVASFERLRDAYIDRNLRGQLGNQASADTLVGALSQVEAAFNEPSDNALAKLFRDFFTTMEQVAANPDEMAPRQAFASAADALAQGFRRLNNELTDISAQSVARMTDTINSINATASRIAQLNTQIRDAVYMGMQPNDMLDERDRLMDQLSGKVNYTYSVNPTSQEVTITFAVDTAGPTNLLLVDPSSPPNGWNAISQADLDSAYTNVPRLLNGGTAFADEEIVNNIVPTYLNRLDALVADFVTGINAAHTSGFGPPNTTFDLNGVAGADIFDPLSLTAASIQLNTNAADNILLNPHRIAAADSWAGTGEPGNGNIFAAMASNLMRGASQGALGGVAWETYYGQTVSLVGTNTVSAQNDLKNRSLLVETLQGRRAEVSGVSLDEEMTNMLRFQHAYNASARVMTAVDESLDTLINRMGRVGL